MKKIIFALASALVLTACGGGTPLAQYLINTDAQASITKGAKAACDATAPSNVIQTNNTGEEQVISIFQLSDGTIYAELTIPTALQSEGPGLDLPSSSQRIVVTGTQAKDVYTLTGSQTDKQMSSPNEPSVTQEADEEVSLNLTADGDFVKGTLSVEDSVTCTGAGCPAGFDAQDCIRTVNVNGQKLPDDGSVSFQNPPGE